VLRPQLQRGQLTCQGIPAAQGSAGPGWNNTTRLSAECKDCGGDEVAGLTRKRVCVPPLAASCCVMRARAKNFLSGLEGRVGRSAGRRSTPYGKDEDQLGYLVPCSSSIDMLPRVTLLSACSHLNQSSSSARTAFCHSADNAANERLILPQLHARTTHQGCVTSQRLVSLVSSDGISVAHSLEGCVQSEGGCS
jgi:hypothetical protein